MAEIYGFMYLSTRNILTAKTNIFINIGRVERMIIITGINYSKWHGGFQKNVKYLVRNT